MKERWKLSEQRFEAGDLKGALELLQSIAADGYLEAYVEIGNLYELGKGGVARDIAQAETWYRKAVESMDDPYGHIGLGRLYFSGNGVPQDFRKALDHLLKAEATQYPQALVMLGLMYQCGWGTAVDLERARSLYVAAANQQFVLAMLYLRNLEFRRRRYIAAIRWQLKVFATTFPLALKNPNDPRLFGLRRDA
jgi:TPR repeat protein